MTGKGWGYTNKINNISVTKRSREKKLVSNDCYDNILYPGYKIYKQADFLVAQIIEKHKILEKNHCQRKEVYQLNCQYLSDQ